jgi:tetratricopeptide (TPR) repeat protein
VLVEGRASELLLPLAGWGQDITVTARALDLHGRTFDEPQISIGEVVEERTDGVVLYRAEMAPVDLPPGNYRLVVTVASPATPTPASRSLRVVAVADGAPLVWAAADLTGSAAASAEPGRRRRSKLKRRTARKAYQSAVLMLADGKQREAQRAVAELERNGFTVDGPRALMVLHDEELDIARELASSDPRSLAPLVMLHHDLVRSYSVRSEGPLATHAWRIAADLAELAHTIAETSDSRLFATQTLASLAGYLIEGSSSLSAAELLRRALKLDPINRNALLGLGIINERQGEYMAAVPFLERLLRVDPENHEARLHFAVNLDRVGRDRGAERAYQTLIDSEAPAWIRTLAFQQLAQRRIDRSRYQEAEQLLRQALEELPDNQRLRIQLAYVLDHSRRPWEATEIVASITPRRGADQSSPRLRYAVWRPTALAAVRQDLERVARAQLPVLVEGVAEMRAAPSRQARDKALARRGWVRARPELPGPEKRPRLGSHDRGRLKPPVRKASEVSKVRRGTR